MKRGLKIAALVGASLALTGCAGIPTAVSFAGMYVNSLLVLRTNKSMTDHVVSAAADQDCGFSNVFEHGDYCIDAPAPPLLAAMTADADMLVDVRVSAPAAAPAVAVAESSGPASASPSPVGLKTGEQTRTQVVEAPPAPASPPAVPPRARRAAPSVVPAAVSPAAVSPAAVSLAAASARAPVAPPTVHRNGDGYLVVLASYRSPAGAAAHQARLKRADSFIVPADVNGVAFHRIALRADSQGAALRLLSQVKASGASGAWVTAATQPPVLQSIAAPASNGRQRPPPIGPSYADAATNPLL